MPAYHTLSALSPCLCEQHIIAFHHIDHLLPGMGVILETPVMERVSAGSIACWIRSRNVTPAASTPIGTLKPTGSTLSHTANTSSNSSASQKTGVLAIRREYP